MVNIGCVQVIFSGKIVMFDENLGTIKADKFVTYYIRSDAVKITVKKQWSLLHHFLLSKSFVQKRLHNFLHAVTQRE